MDDLESIIISHEGKQKSAYRDSLGYLTIGIGRLIDKRKNAGLSDDEMLYLLRNDIAEAERQLMHFDWYKIQDIVRQDVLIEFVFNIGLEGVLEFKQMIAALEDKDYMKASTSMLNSKWAEQVGTIRSHNMAQRMLTGSYDK
jgi:lysozyme